MKTRTIIIMGIIIAAISIVSFSLAYNQEIKLATGMMTSDEKPEPKHIPDLICLVIHRATSSASGGVITIDQCFPLSDFENLGCDREILEYIYKYTSLLDDEFDGNYYQDLVVLPEGVSEEEYEECFDNIYQMRLSFHFKKLLTENQIDSPKGLVVKRAISIDGDSACGIAVDDSDKLHWFAVDSFSNPHKMTVFQENPQPCKVNTASCFCDAYVELVASTTELDYFTLEEERKYSDILIDYLAEENINRTPKFLIGKLNINYTDSAIGYCGQIWGENTYGFFSGGIINDTVADYGIDRELPLLCAISDDANWQERK